MTMLHCCKHIHCMITYMEQLVDKSVHLQIKLKDAFTCAGVPDSTFYRARMGKDLRYDTANRVSKAIEKLSSLQSRD